MTLIANGGGSDIEMARMPLMRLAAAVQVIRAVDVRITMTMMAVLFKVMAIPRSCQLPTRIRQ